MSKRRIFETSLTDPWRKNAVIGGHFADGTSYELSFSEAAVLLGDKALETGLLDSYFYPMCFLFRHAFELTLKSLILEAERLLEELSKHGETNVQTDVSALADRLRTHKKAHSLHWLLNQLEPRLVEIPDCEPIPVRTRDAIIELHNIDPHGETFRYSLDRSGAKHLPKVTHVDVERVKNGLGEAHRLLCYGLGTWLYENRATAAQLRRELEAEIESDAYW